MPRLRDLEAQFLKAHLVTEAEWQAKPTPGVSWSGPYWSYRKVDTLVEADGIKFLCPGCYARNNGPVGTHIVMVGFVGCPKDAYTTDYAGNHVAWHPSGSGYDDLVLTPSIDLAPPGAYIELKDGCRWHGFVGTGSARPGEAQ